MTDQVRTFEIQGRPIGLTQKPYIIAEISANHGGKLERALKITEEAAKAGADAIKLQTYSADTMTIDLRKGDFMISDPKSLWNGYSLYDLYKEAATPWEWHAPLIARAKELGMACFSTPFDDTAVDFLEKLKLPAYKIASFENTDLRLVRKVGGLRKPVIASTGMANLGEISELVNTLVQAGASQIALLKCTSTYPANPTESNVRSIPHMREMFKTEIGLSDHTMGVGAAVAAVALGATVIEKHFTLSRADGGPDAAFSMEPHELKALVIETERAWQALGHVQYGAEGREKNSLQFRRSLYVVEDMKAGDVLSAKNLRAIRPGFGLPPKWYEVVIGKKINKNVERGTALSWDHLG